MILTDGVGHGLIHDRTEATALWRALRKAYPTAYVLLMTHNGMPSVPAASSGEPRPRAYNGPLTRTDGVQGVDS